MYYFPSREAAGDLLADQLAKYRYENTAVVCLSDGAVSVGARVAIRLHSSLSLLLTEAIHLQGESDVLAQIDQVGDVTYNDMYSAGELEEMRAENFSYIEQQKLQKIISMNRLIGQGGEIQLDLLRNRTIIVVSDGLANGLSMRAASEFLKPIKIERLVMVTPFASVPAVDQMHVLADEIVCINVIEDIISIDHYYDNPAVPTHEEVVAIINDIIMQWKDFQYATAGSEEQIHRGV